MGFYEQISKYYDYIFPVGQQQIEFIKASSGFPPKKILDVACGSGGYSIELAKSGYALTAVDLDEKMIEMTREKALKEKVKLNAFQCDMKELDKVRNQRGNSPDSPFELIFCIGNSIVHLGSISDITDTLKQMHSLLSQHGILIVQIINYDRIINHQVNELPAIKNDEAGVEFIRKYEYNEGEGTISFNTILNVNIEDIKERYENSVKLLPILKEDMLRALKEAGFEKTKLYGDFNNSPYDDDSYMLVIKAEK